jgi:hypothetical protein
VGFVLVCALAKPTMSGAGATNIPAAAKSSFFAKFSLREQRFLMVSSIRFFSSISRSRRRRWMAFFTLLLHESQILCRIVDAVSIKIVFAGILGRTGQAHFR